MSVRTEKNGQIVKRGEKDSGTELRGLLTKMTPQIAMALPKHITPERLVRVAMTAITQNPKLIQCTQGSFFACLLTAAQLGLEPNTPLGQGYLIPRWNSRAQQLECTWQIGYQGFIDLAYRSGMVTSIRANVVREGDAFEWAEGLEPKLEHRPTSDPDRHNRRILFAYAVVRIRDADPHFEVLSFAEIERRRLMNDAEKQDKFSPWTKHYEAMAKKTAIRAALKLAPKSAELIRVETMETAADGYAKLTEAVDPRIADAIASQGMIIDAPPELEAPEPMEWASDKVQGTQKAPSSPSSNSGSSSGKRRSRRAEAAQQTGPLTEDEIAAGWDWDHETQEKIPPADPETGEVLG